MAYGLKEFKALVEKAYRDCRDPMQVPFTMDPHSQEAINYRSWRAEAFNYVLEMMPEIEGED